MSEVSCFVPFAAFIGFSINVKVFFTFSFRESTEVEAAVSGKLQSFILMLACRRWTRPFSPVCFVELFVHSSLSVFACRTLPMVLPQDILGP